MVNKVDLTLEFRGFPCVCTSWVTRTPGGQPALLYLPEYRDSKPSIASQPDSPIFQRSLIYQDLPTVLSIVFVVEIMF